MRNVVVGSFLGFVLAAAFLAACGSGGEDGGDAGPVPLSTPSAMRWTALGTRQIVATGVNLERNGIWTSTLIHDNSTPEARYRYATFDLGLNVESLAAGHIAIDIGILPATEGQFFATDPMWLGTLEIETRNNRRAVRIRSSSAATARVLTFGMTPYTEELQ